MIRELFKFKFNIINPATKTLSVDSVQGTRIPSVSRCALILALLFHLCLGMISESSNAAFSTLTEASTSSPLSLPKTKEEA